MGRSVERKIIEVLKREGLTVKESLDVLKKCKSQILSNLKSGETLNSDLEKAIQLKEKFIPEDSNGKHCDNKEKMTFEEYCNKCNR
jgi:peptidoglycan hydrolase CwlO-like protein